MTPVRQAKKRRLVLDAKAKLPKELQQERAPKLEAKPLTASIGERCIARQIARMASERHAVG